MKRLLFLLVMLALVLTNSVATAAALCQHESAEAHASARQSGEAAVAAGAIIEEAAAVAASSEAALADAGGFQLGGYLRPSDPVLPTPGSLDPAHPRPADAARRPGLVVSPLLQPPLG